MAENARPLAEIETRDTGKIIRETSAQIAYVADYYRYYAGLADKIEGAHLPIDKPDMEVWLRREPIGVVAAIVPWNSQLFLAAVKIGPALAAGCTLVVKASEDGPGAAAGVRPPRPRGRLPAGRRQRHHRLRPACGSALTRHPGGRPYRLHRRPGDGARTIVRNSAENLASTSLELGGKSPFVVFADADLESAANAQVAGIFAAAGQSCVAGSRLIVERSVKDAFLARLKAKAEAVQHRLAARHGHRGRPARHRPPARACRATSSPLRSAAGARQITGGPVDGPGWYWRPTILDCDGITSPSLTEEFFGPVLSGRLLRRPRPRRSRLANDTAFGLASGVFTREPRPRPSA